MLLLLLLLLLWLLRLRLLSHRNELQFIEILIEQRLTKLKNKFIKFDTRRQDSWHFFCPHFEQDILDFFIATFEMGFPNLLPCDLWFALVCIPQVHVFEFIFRKTRVNNVC